MQTIEKIHPAEKTELKCKKCLSPIYYEKVDIRRDGDFDWYLNVVCLCGVVEDARVIEDCYNIHRRRACENIQKAQNKTIASILGPDLAKHIHNMNGGSF